MQRNKEMHNKKALITGGSGYFGETLVLQLIKRGYRCSVLDLNNPGPEISHMVDFFQIDIRNKLEVEKACEGIDYIFHNVAQVPLAKNKDLFNSVNNIGTQNIIEAGILNNCEHLIYTSSSAVFGVPEKNPVNENTIPIPQEAYGEAKLDGELNCNKYLDQGMKISIIRPRTILGHGRLGIFQILFEWIYTGKNVPVFDGGDNLYQFIHTDDLASASILTAENNQDGLYNIGTNDFGTMKETLEALIKHAGTKSTVRSVPSFFIIPIMKICSFFGLSPLGPYHALMYGKSMYFDTTKAHKDLNWTPAYSNVEMIIQSYDWYVENRNLILERTENTSPHKSAIKQGILSLVGRFL